MSRLPSLGPRGEGWFVAQLAILFVVGIAPGADPWRSALASPASLFAPIGWLIAACGIVVTALAVMELNAHRAMSVLPRPREDAELVETGPYALVRHPVYSGLALVSVGWAIAQGSPLTFFAALALIAVLYLKAMREEAWLAGRFPGYRAYQARTKRLIPGLL